MPLTNVTSYKPPFITQISPTVLTDLALSAKDATAQGKLRAALTALKTLCCTQKKGTAMYSPDFDKIAASEAAAIAREIDAISAAITP